MDLKDLNTDGMKKVVKGTLSARQRWVEWDKVEFGIFLFRVGFDGLYRWVEWDKVALGVFFPSGWDLMDCVGGWSGIKWR